MQAVRTVGTVCDDQIKVSEILKCYGKGGKQVRDVGSGEGSSQGELSGVWELFMTIRLRYLQS